MRAVFRPDPSRLDSEWWTAARTRLGECPAVALAVFVEAGPDEHGLAYVPIEDAVAALEWCATIPGWADPSGILPLPLRVDLDESDAENPPVI